MENTLVSSKQMLCIYTSSIYLPYKLQPFLNVILPYEEYREFVKWLVNKKLNCLKFKSEFYDDALNNRDESIFLRCYYVDTANVILRELRLALLEGEDCTAYTVSFGSEVKSVHADTLLNSLLDEMSVNVDKLIHHMAEINALCPDADTLSTANKKAYSYYLILRLLPFSKQLEKVNIIY